MLLFVVVVIVVGCLLLFVVGCSSLFGVLWFGVVCCLLVAGVSLLFVLLFVGCRVLAIVVMCLYVS